MSFFERFKITLRRDHQQHFILGFIVGLIGLGIEGYNCFTLLYWPTLIAIQIVAYGIEFIQNYMPHRHVEASDAFATVAGGVAGMLLFELGLDLMYMFQ
jgi:VanZ family protein